MGELASAWIEITARKGGLDRVLAKTRGELGGFVGASNKILAGIGVGALGIAGVGKIFGGAVSTAVELEKALGGVGKAADLSPGGLARFKGEIFNLSTELKGVKLDDLIAIATTGAKLGISAEGLIDYTRGVAMASAAIDDIPAEQLANDLGQLQSVFKGGSLAPQQYASAIDKIADSGVSSASGILEVTKRISGSAVAAKVSAQESIALAGALLDTGSHSELAATSIQRLIMAMNDAGAQAGFAGALGISTEEFAQQVATSPFQAITSFLDAVRQMDAAAQVSTLKGIGVEGIQGIGEIQKLAQNVDSVRRYASFANQEFVTLNQNTKSYAANAALAGSAWTTARNQIQILQNSLGEKLLSPMQDAISLTTELGSQFKEAFGVGPIQAFGDALKTTVGTMRTLQELSKAAGPSPMGQQFGGVGSVVDFFSGSKLSRTILTGLVSPESLTDAANRVAGNVNASLDAHGGETG